MNCPNCDAEMVVQPFQATGRDWLTCAGPDMCGLCGPRDVIERLAARLALASEMYDLIGRASQTTRPTQQQAAWMDDAATLRARWQHEALRKEQGHG